MRLAFLVPAVARSGGIDVLLGHARRLQSSHGADIDIVSVAPVEDGQSGESLPVISPPEAQKRHYDVAMGTWWETLYGVFDLNADHYAGFIQSFEQRFYERDDRTEQLAAASAYGLPLHFIAAATWMAGMLARLHPGRTCAAVPNGIDKELFTCPPGPRKPGPLRVLIEGQPQLWFKGIPDAIASVGLMKGAAETTLVCLEPPAQSDLPVDRVLSSLDHDRMRAIYQETDVLVKMSRVEGLGLPPLEAFHCGVPCVVTPFTGHEEYVEHGENGFVCGFDDPATAASYLDRLASDSALLERLSAGALQTAAAWPSTEDSTARLAAVLGEIQSSPPVDTSQAREQIAGFQRSLALGRESRVEYDRGRSEYDQQVEDLERDLTSATKELDALRRALHAHESRRIPWLRRR